MHDPSTLAFSIKSPIKRKSSLFKEGYRDSLADIWHVDPCKDGTDDSCGWFMRPRHGDKQVLERIVKAFDFDWDRVFKSDSGHVYHVGYFHPEDDGAGMPNMSVSAIVLNLFFLAAMEHFKSDGRTNWKKAKRYMQSHLFDILHFAENPTDSLRQSIVRFWGTDTKRDERIRELAGCIYAYILRDTRPWWRHPRWHVHHWKLQIHFTQKLKRWLFSRCCKCGKRFTWGYSPVTDSWHGTGPRWFKGEPNIYHSSCDRPADPCVSSTNSNPRNAAADTTTP